MKKVYNHAEDEENYYAALSWSRDEDQEDKKMKINKNTKNIVTQRNI